MHIKRKGKRQWKNYATQHLYVSTRTDCTYLTVPSRKKLGKEGGGGEKDV